MSDEQNDGFLGRWSRRKVQARTGRPVEEPPQPVAPKVAPSGMGDAADLPVNVPQARTDAAEPAIETEAPTLTLDDVKSLTHDADFQPFVARGVAPEVRNAAFKKLFTDPHFNVMDGLDIYIDDYSLPDPLPASTLAQLASAHFLKLVDAPPPESAAQAPEGPPGDAPPLQECEQAAADPASPLADATADMTDPERGPGSADMAPSGPCNELQRPSAEGGTHAGHDDADLRLQSHDAAGRQADWPGAG